MSELDKLQALVLAQQKRLELTEPFYQQHLACDPRLDYDHASGRLMYEVTSAGIGRERYCLLDGSGDSLRWHFADTRSERIPHSCLVIYDGLIQLSTYREDGGRFPCFIEISRQVRVYRPEPRSPCNQSLIAEWQNREQLIIAAKAKGIPIEDHRTSNALKERFHYFLK